jgi:hypothetical protein
MLSMKRVGISAALTAVLLSSACKASVAEPEGNKDSRVLQIQQELRGIPVEPEEAVASISALVKSGKPHAPKTLRTLFADKERVKVLHGEVGLPVTRSTRGQKVGRHLLQSLKVLARGGPEFEDLLVSGLSELPTFGSLFGGDRYSGTNSLRVEAMGYVPRPSESTYEVLRRLMALPEGSSLPPPPTPFVPKGRWEDWDLLYEERSYVVTQAGFDLSALTSPYAERAVQSLCRIGTDRSREILLSELRKRYERYGDVGLFGWGAASEILRQAERYRDRPAIFSLLVDAWREFGERSPFIIEMILSEQWRFRFRGEAGYVPVPSYRDVAPPDAAAYAAGFRSILDSTEGREVSDEKRARLRELLELMLKKEAEDDPERTPATEGDTGEPAEAGR